MTKLGIGQEKTVKEGFKAWPATLQALYGDAFTGFGEAQREASDETKNAYEEQWMQEKELTDMFKLLAQHAKESLDGKFDYLQRKVEDDNKTFRFNLDKFG